MYHVFNTVSTDKDTKKRPAAQSDKALKTKV